jgi:hypothetical protein
MLSPPFFLLDVASPLADVVMTPCRVTLPSYWAKTSSLPPLHFFDNILSCRIPSRTETEALNPHHHRKLPSPDHPTLTLHYYKKIISILITLSITEPRSLFCLLPSQSTTWSELHSLSSFPFTAISYPSSLHIMTPTVTN